MSNPSYQRPQAAELLQRLGEPRRFIQIVTGARQVGKTTLITQVAKQSSKPYRFASADEPTLRGPEWVAQQWEAARLLAECWPACRNTPATRRGGAAPARNCRSSIRP
ncbi:MAG: AAA family ATPase [Gammaproteobacteria bacterium]|nr:AAA family ATPase [Gammaproteobacteria bacterium]